MLKIRMTRLGTNKTPYYRIVVADSRKARDGKYIEQLGTFNPLASPEEIKVDVERAKYWIANGAQPSDTVKALLKKSGYEAAKKAKVAKAAKSTKKSK